MSEAFPSEVAVENRRLREENERLRAEGLATFEALQEQGAEAERLRLRVGELSHALNRTMDRVHSLYEQVQELKRGDA